MEGKFKKVFLVEDDPTWTKLIKRRLDDKVTVLSASTIEEAKKIFSEHPDITLIVMDACVPGDTPNTQPLVQRIRKTFAGPIIATSSMSEYREQLIGAGCNYQCEKPKVSEKVLEILGVS